jgi:hypothetical protein
VICGAGCERFWAFGAGDSFYMNERVRAPSRQPTAAAQTVLLLLLLLESSLACAACVRCVLPIVYASADRQTHTAVNPLPLN